ncbi:MAG TPA: ChbG/HpnK family deacetylase [Acidobacteriaceae bacterium]|nr:ChbG/HpnK family deacetylase [Acidobacteriaceae bacterium]
MDTPQPAERRLIINADDFGLTEGVNRAVLELNAAEVLPSTTLMATGRAFRDAVHSAFVQTSLGVGCHVVLVNGRPELHPAELPTLAPEGRLRSSLTTFMVDLFGGRIASREIEREAIAQIRQLQSAGITVTHLDTHKHTHMFPRVLGPLIRAARACNVPAIRNPFEPDWSLRLTEKAPRTRRLQVRTLRLFREQFLRSVRAARLRTTDGALGVLATGTFDAAYVLRLLRNMPPGTWELVCHPGYVDGALRRAGTRLVTARETERVALLHALENPPEDLPRIDLMHYGEFTS